VLLGLLILVALSGGFVRSLGGDFLVVQWLYLGTRIVFKSAPRHRLAVYVLLFACLIELVQLVFSGQIPNSLLFQLTLGTTFHWLDLLMYALGVLVIYFIDDMVCLRFLR